MKLTCAVLLVLAGFVSATPHGYGVKGGASSRADASASAGAFGASGIPVPLGGSYSGSFSKSSSSSSSSSSASSSSSSSSFSYNGSGSGFTGFGSNGATALGTGGCGSGSCHGAHGISATQGSSNAGAGQAYNAASAVASAGATAGTFSGPGCQGSNCNEHSTQCTSGQCKPSSESGNKCSSGQCGSGQDDNDISVNTDTTKLSHDSKEKTSNNDKKETEYTGAVSDCFTGNCGSSAATKPQADGSVNSYGSSLSNNNQHSATSDSDIFAGYHKPASYLETPKLGPSCTSGNCGSGPSGTGTGNLPSSYNVPIHGTYDSNDQKPACTSGNCDSYTNSNSPSTNYLTPQRSDAANDISKSSSSVQSPIDAPGVTNCAGQNCGTSSNPAQIGHSFTTPSLSQVHNGLPSHNVPSSGSGSTDCQTSDCGSYPSRGVPSVVTKPNYGAGPSSNQIPEYTGSFGGYIDKPYEFATPAFSNGPSHSTTPSFNAPSIGITASGCKTPDCADSGAVPGVIVPSTSFGVTHPGSVHQSTAGATANADAHVGSFGVVKPNTPSKEKLPVYTGGFGGPGGVLKPNEFNAIPGKPGYTHSGTYTPLPSTSTSNCNTPNCGGHSNAAAAAAAGANAQSGSFGTIKPNADASSLHEKLPTYTGGFGGPAGVLAPAHVHGSVPHSPGYSHSGIPSIVPSVSVNTAGCKTPNCASYPSAGAQSSAGANAVSGSFDLNKKSTGLTPASQKNPSYTGGFGTPAGIPSVPTGASIGPAVAHPASPPYSTPSAIGPSTTCTTPNCAYPTAGAAADAHSGSFDAKKPSTELPSYTGGFGGPSGIYKPDEYTAPALVPGSSSGGAATECKTSNCAGAGYPAGVHKPDDLIVHGAGANNPSYSPSASSSFSTPTGNSGNHAVGVTAGSNAQSETIGITKPSGGDLTSDKLPAHTGGFSAPAGVLKPNEAGAPTAAAGTPSFIHTGPSSYYTPTTTGTTSCKTPNCGSYPSAVAGAEAGAHAQAGSNGVTKPASDSSWDKELPPYTGGFGGPSGLLKPNEYTAPAVGVTPAIGVSNIDLHKPTGPVDNSKPASCTSGACAHQTSSPSSSHAAHTGVSNGAQAMAGASANADAVTYTGGFGGPSGFLQPHEDAKFGAAGVAGKQTIAAQLGSHQAPSGISSHGTSGSGSHAVSTAQAGGAGLTSGVAHAGAVAQAGATATATSGAISGYDFNGHHGDHTGHGVKGGCSGGCGGSYNGGSNFGYSGGLGLSKPGYVDGLSGSLSSSGASAKSLAGASAFSHGGSFASSSATAHASAGASVKGGYGRR